MGSDYYHPLYSCYGHRKENMNKNIKAGLQWIALISIVVGVIFIIMGLFYNPDVEESTITKPIITIVKNESLKKDSNNKILPNRMNRTGKTITKPFDYQEPNMTVRETINNATRTTTVRRIPVR